MSNLEKLVLKESSENLDKASLSSHQIFANIKDVTRTARDNHANLSSLFSELSKITQDENILNKLTKIIESEKQVFSKSIEIEKNWDENRDMVSKARTWINAAIENKQ